MDKPVSRLASIDIFRAITMFLMIFVNDLDPVPKVPEWIKHVGENVDGLGFADIIFPAFLFIVGLSIPLALNKRIKRGDPKLQVAGHIISRGFALLVMGFYQVNLESYNTIEHIIPKPVWEIGITLSFFLIWLNYPSTMPKRRKQVLQLLGIVILIVMSLLYRGTEDGVNFWLRPHWWGILGLIGWSYLFCALIYFFTKGKFGIQLLTFLFFFVFNVAAHAHWLGFLEGIHHYVWIVGNGSLMTLTMGGIVISLWYLDWNAMGRHKSYFAWMALAGAGMIGVGFALRSLGGISKLHDTPAWVSICMGISILAFALLIYLIDLRHQEKWFKWVMPAGTSTLTAYLIPYLLYSVFYLFHFLYPFPFNEGIGGIIRCFAVSYFCVWVTGWLEKRHWNLKI